MPQFLWYHSLVYFSSSRTSLGPSQGFIGTGQYPKERTVLPVKDIILLLGFCLHTTYFSFQGQFYEEVEGSAMGSSVSPIIGNIYVEYFEQNLKYCHPLPRLWHRFVHDTFVIQKEDNKHNFLEHINSVNLAIKFMVEDKKEDSVIPFLDTIVKPEADGRLSITVYHPHRSISTVGHLPSPISI